MAVTRPIRMYATWSWITEEMLDSVDRDRLDACLISSAARKAEAEGATVIPDSARVEISDPLPRQHFLPDEWQPPENARRAVVTLRCVAS